jgi:hypothetical protein
LNLTTGDANPFWLVLMATFWPRARAGGLVAHQDVPEGQASEPLGPSAGLDLDPPSYLATA